MTAYEAGYDSVLNGPNTSNCHFRNFMTPESTAEWERGRDQASEEVAAIKGGKQ